MSPRSNARSLAAKTAKDKMKNQSQAMSSGMEKGEEPEWEKINKGEKNNKRGHPKGSMPPMEIQPNEDRVRELTTQIAVLQRELQLEVQGRENPVTED